MNPKKKYLENPLGKPVFSIEVALFCQGPLPKIVAFDADLNSTSKPSGFRNSPSNIVNPNKKYLENSLGKPVFWAQVALFGQRPPPKIVPFDADFNSAPNPSGFRNNPNRIANLVLTFPAYLHLYILSRL